MCPNEKNESTKDTRKDTETTTSTPDVPLAAPMDDDSQTCLWGKAAFGSSDDSDLSEDMKTVRFKATDLLEEAGLYDESLGLSYQQKGAHSLPDAVRIKTSATPTLTTGFRNVEHAASNGDLSVSAALPNVDVDKSFDMVAIGDALPDTNDVSSDIMGVNGAISTISSSVGSAIDEAWDDVMPSQEFLSSDLKKIAKKSEVPDLFKAIRPGKSKNGDVLESDAVPKSLPALPENAVKSTDVKPVDQAVSARPETIKPVSPAQAAVVKPVERPSTPVGAPVKPSTLPSASQNVTSSNNAGSAKTESDEKPRVSKAGLLLSNYLKASIDGESTLGTKRSGPSGTEQKPVPTSETKADSTEAVSETNDNAKSSLANEKAKLAEIDKTIDLETIEAADIERLTAAGPGPCKVPQDAQVDDDSSSIEFNFPQAKPVPEVSREITIHSDEKDFVFQAISDDDVRCTDNGEVFASKLLKKGRYISAVSHSSDMAAPVKPAGLPTSSLHPDDRNSGMSGYENADFVLEHLFVRDNRQFLGEHVSCVGREDALARMLDIMQSEKIKRYPRVVEIRAEHRMEAERFIEALVEQCRNAFSHLSLYATTSKNRDNTDATCLSTLLESRLGIQRAFDISVKTERILRTVPELIDAEDKTWAQNVLFQTFDLDVLVKPENAIDRLEMSIDSQRFELFLKGLRHDAERGPVMVLITEAYHNRYDGWREVVSQIRKHRIANVCVVVCGEATSDVEVSECIELEPLSNEAMSKLANMALKRINNVPASAKVELIKRSHGRVAVFWHLLQILQIRGVIDMANKTYVESKSDVLRDLPESYEELVAHHFELLTPDQAYLMTVASILGEPFKLEDISVVLALEPLPEEIPWFHDLRHDWTKRVLGELIELGDACEIVDTDSDDQRVIVGYVVRDANGADQIAARTDESYTQAMHGCYAQLLSQHSATDLAVGRHFEAAGMWTEAIEFYLKLAETRLDDFFNVTSLHILNNCLNYAAPQYGPSFVLLQKLLATLATRFGQYPTAAEHYNAMLRVAQLMRDPLRSVEAFIGLSSALLAQGLYDEARDILLFGLKLAEQTNDKKLVARCYRGLAEIVFRTGAKGAIVGSMRYVERAIEIYRDISDLPELAKTLGLSAEIYVVRGDLKRAQSSLSEAYMAFKTEKRWFQIPPILAVLSDICIRRKNYREAIRHLREGFDIVRKTDDIAQLYRLICKHIELYIAIGNRDVVREDMEKLDALIAEHPYLPWIVETRLLKAQFDFSRSSFQKTTKALKAFFDVATQLKNMLLMSRAYALSARLNDEVYNRHLGQVSLEKTDKLFTSATHSLESIGAWHDAADNQRHYADYLDRLNRFEEAQKCRERANKVDPYCQ